MIPATALPALRFATLFVFLLTPRLWAADATADWERVVALDAGPKVQARSQQEARQIAVGHLDQQEQALRSFLANHAGAAPAFEARLRLSRVLQIRADFEISAKSTNYRAEAKRLLDDAEKTAAPGQQKEVAFARIAYLMRVQRSAGELNREQLLNAMRGFQRDYPEDRRLPMLMVEIAKLLDAQPRQKRALLSDALVLAQNDELKARISDDLKRLDLLDQPFSLSFTSVQGTPFDLAQQATVSILGEVNLPDPGMPYMANMTLND
ncbi:MAG: hypothetical protein EOP84_36890, partial [Verrucomicrobiaceae bacterium]